MVHVFLLELVVNMSVVLYTKSTDNSVLKLKLIERCCFQSAIATLTRLIIAEDSESIVAEKFDCGLSL